MVPRAAIARSWPIGPDRLRGLYRRRFKRLLDLSLVALALPGLAPLIALLWLLARADGGPGFHAQWRVGRDGRGFRCWKIRSMAPDAEARLAALLARDAGARRQWRLRAKLDPDPRVTRLGRVLRRASLDELPQLWCVWRGEMSLVGPRPVTRSELARYGLRARAYLSVRPGLTGPWQVSDRGGAYAARVRIDAAYPGACCLRGDLALMWRTLGAVLRGTGR